MLNNSENTISRILEVRMCYNEHSGNYFIDFLNPPTEEKNPGNYIVSIKLPEGIARSISRDLGISITK